MRNRFTAAAVAVATAFAGVLGFGFWIHEKTGGGPIPDGPFGLLAALAIAAVAGAVFCGLTGVRPELQWRPVAARTAGGPVTPASQKKTVEQISYETNPLQLAACVHLRPIERAMRRAGLRLQIAGHHSREPAVSAECRINEAGLRRVFALPASVYYKEQYQPERSQWDNPRADIYCAECLVKDRERSGIGVLHPDECREETPWFPLAPPPATSGRASGPDSLSTRRP
jgi:hypothetical protein